ncbi:MAG: single-stranded DNA-binding protein [Chloroherpetonaceae bacterium]|nr:single-stranded DNA-binding protein [Chloroherpetonaceae bacterium]MDW8438142.1 single-stranded DNA-binding protein [Chloroherpetonaceae bacterium]
MAGSLNKVMLIGRLGADPELRTTPNGNQVVNFNLATDESYKDKNGQKVERTEWHRIVVWDKLAEICKQYLTKGKLVYIEGRLTTRSWEDKETGKKNYITEIVATDMTMLDSKVASSPPSPPEPIAYGEANAPSATPKASAPKPQPAPESSAAPKDDDLPF